MSITRVAIYCRVSTKDKGQDVENQLRQLREFCTKQDHTVVHEYVDHASGKRSDRDAFKEMFAAASRREFNVVLFWALDRFSREGVLDTLQHLQRLTSCGVGYRSYTEQYLDSCGMFREAVVGILAAVAKQERVRLSERTVAGLERARAHRWKTPGGLRPQQGAVPAQQRPVVGPDRHRPASVQDNRLPYRQRSIVKL